MAVPARESPPVPLTIDDHEETEMKIAYKLGIAVGVQTLLGTL